MATQNLLSRKTTLITSIVVFLLTSIIILALWLFDLRKSATLDLIVAPQNAHIDIGGKTFKNGIHRLEPGSYSISITQDGFTPYQTTINLYTNETYELYTYILPKDGSYDWYIDHPDDATLLTTIGDRTAEKNSDSYARIDPILLLTPYTDPNNRFRIDSNITSETPTIAVFSNTCSATSTTIYQAEAKNWLRSHNINLENYQLTFTTLCD